MENVAIRFPFVADIALEVIAFLLSAATDDIPAEGMVRIPDGQLPSPFLHRRPERNDIKPVLFRERGIGVMKLVVHLILINAPLLQPLVPRRIAPGLLHQDLRLRRQLMDLRNQIVAIRMIGLRLPALVTSLLDRDDVPLRPGDDLQHVPLRAVDDALSADDAIVAVGTKRPVHDVRRIRPMLLQRAAADVKGREVELLSALFGDLRQMVQHADREAVADHQHLDGLTVLICLLLDGRATGRKSNRGDSQTIQQSNNQAGFHAILLRITPLR